MFSVLAREFLPLIFFFVRYICSKFSRETNFKFDIFTDIILLFYILIVTYQFMSKVVWDLKTTWILEHAGCRGELE